MSIQKKLIAVIGAGVLTFFAATATAATLDFTERAFIGANGNVAGTTYAITTSPGGLLSFNDTVSGGTCVGLACVLDGLGVGDDEITIGDEEIRIDFGTTVRITDLAFLDLFSSSNGDNQERALVSYSGGSMFFDSLLSETSGDSGFRAVHGLNILTTFLVFGADGTNDGAGFDDFALAAIGVSAVPLPPAVLMFGAAMGGVGLLARRRKKRNV